MYLGAAKVPSSTGGYGSITHECPSTIPSSLRDHLSLMNAEIQTYLGELRWILSQLVVSLNWSQ